MMAQTPAASATSNLERAAVQFPARASVVVMEEWPDREAILVPPLSGDPVALAVELHGSGLDPLRQYRMSGLADLLTAEDVAVLLPQAAMPFRLIPELASGFAWNVPGVPLPGAKVTGEADIDDIGYLIALVRTFRTKLHLVDAPLFLVGYSGGARLASDLIASGVVDWTAAGLVAGLRPARNARRRPPPTISFHGVEDSINPFAGGTGPRWDMGVEEACRLYALSQSGAVDEALQVPGADLRIYRSSDGKQALSTYTVKGAAHAWPGTRDEDHLKVFGPAGDGTDASALIADFFIERLTAGEAATRQTEHEGLAR